MGPGLSTLFPSAECLGESHPEALQRLGQDSWDKRGPCTAELTTHRSRTSGQVGGLKDKAARIGRAPPGACPSEVTAWA